MDPFTRALERAEKKRNSLLSEDSMRISKSLKAEVRREPALNTGTSQKFKEISLTKNNLFKQQTKAKNKKALEAKVSYEVLATKVTQQLASHQSRAALVTSTSSGEDKTRVASYLSLAMSISQSVPVLLLDLNRQNPNLDRFFALNTNKGIVDLLKNQCSLDEIGYTVRGTKLSILPWGQPDANLSLSQEVTPFLMDIHQRFREHIVIIDTPPILESADVVTLIPKVPDFLLVSSYGSTRQREISTAMRRIEDGRMLGAVLDGSRESRTDMS